MTAAFLKLRHLGINQSVCMPVIVSSFESSVTPKWASKEVYGRMDPIFSYQNTVRTFTAVIRTPSGGEVLPKDAVVDWKNQAKHERNHGGATTSARNEQWLIRLLNLEEDLTIDGGGTTGHFGTSTEDPDEVMCDEDITTMFLPILADLYKLMYPVYEPLPGVAASSVGTGYMRGAPLLELSLDGLAYTDYSARSGASAHGLLFVPETFKVTSLTDEQNVSIAMSDISDLRFHAAAKGYTITLGGTILHAKNRVGFTIGTNGVRFGQGANFPYNTEGVSQFWEPPDLS